jgi:polyhydroxyalkanoate synthase
MSFVGLMPDWTASSGDSPLSRPIRRLVAEHARLNPDTVAGGGRALFDRSGLDVAAFVDALTREAKARMDRLLEGVLRYQNHPYRRTRPAPPPVWTRGAAALRDYGGKGPAVLFVPSLVNRAYILDLAEGRSLLAAAAGSGLRAFLLDWGEPGAAERDYSVDDYVAHVLVPTLAHVEALTGAPPSLVGYCMGGTLAAAAAVLRPDLVARLALLAAPWDFHADSAAARAFLATFRPVIEGLIAAQGCASVDFLQAMFASLDPTLVGRKFRGFAARDMNTEAARRFVELEDWLNDGVPLVANVARQCLFDWYSDNVTLTNRWRIGGTVIDPAVIAAPTLAVIPSQDRIVPPESAKALARRIPICDTRVLDLGHIGMMAGGSAAELLYAPLVAWLKE